MKRMEKATDTAAQLLERIKAAFRDRNLTADFRPLTPEARARLDAEGLNAQIGSENAVDGYDCPKCLNRGMVYIAEGCSVTACRCDCWPARRSIRRMKQSGLGHVIDRCTFENYKAETEWQRRIKEAAEAFADDSEGKWFFIGGACGAGKTHLCTAICRNLLKSKEVYYMLWEEECPKLKGMITDGERYAQNMQRLKDVDVLYIDDFFSRRKSEEEGAAMPTDADIRLAREILNHRIVNRKTTIISTEWYAMEIVDLDKGLGSRIIEMCGEMYSRNLERTLDKNFRLKMGGVML